MVVQKKTASVYKKYSPSINMHSNHLCTNCLHTISNPICGVCFLRELEIWLRDNKIIKKEQTKILKDMRNAIDQLGENPSQLDCVICNSRKVDLCMYCLVWKTKRILQKHIHQKKVLNHFDEIFNYNIWLH